MTKDQSQVVLRALRQLEKVLTADDKPLAAAYVKAKAWDANQSHLTTEELRRAFARRLSLKVLLDPNQLKQTIRDGAEHGIWVYFDTQEQLGYGAVSPAPMVRISEDAVLYAPVEAKARNLNIKGEAIAAPPGDERCPVCGNEISDCTCDEAGSDVRPRPTLTSDGAPGQAFQAIVDQARDAKIERLAELTIEVDGQDKDGAHWTRGIGLAIPQLGRGEFALDQQLTAQFGDESFQMSYTGGWDRYKRVKQLTDVLVQEATRLSAHSKLSVRWAEGLVVDGNEIGEMRDVFDQLGFGRIRIEATPMGDGPE